MLVNLLQSIIEYIYSFFEWIFPDPYCPVCNNQPKFKPEEFVLKYGLLLFIKIPAIIITWLATYSIYWVIFMIYLCVRLDGFIKTP